MPSCSGLWGKLPCHFIARVYCLVDKCTNTALDRYLQPSIPSARVSACSPNPYQPREGPCLSPTWGGACEGRNTDVSRTDGCSWEEGMEDTCSTGGV